MELEGDEPVIPDWDWSVTVSAHWYVSTACWHGLHGDPKRHAECRITCKFCGGLCRCPYCAHKEREEKVEVQ